MNADVLLNALREQGFGMYSGVPCSYLTPLINAAIDAPNVRYINAANEGEAVAICSGAELGGVRSAAMFQNSGLGNAVSPLTSLNAIFRIPILLLVTWRGRPGGAEDEPQHALMGQITPTLLDTMQIPHTVFQPADEGDLQRLLRRAVDSMESTRLPFAFVLPKLSIDARPLNSQPPAQVESSASIADPTVAALDVDDVLAAIAAGASLVGAAVLATTGFTGRALYNVGDRNNQLYMVGSMGCVSSLGLGLALARPDRQIIAVDGDGALLMRMGSMGAVGAASPENLTHIVLDNGVHDSTGAQSTLSNSVNIPAVAAACGYPQVEVARTLDHLQSLVGSVAQSLRLIYVRTRPRADRKLPRPAVTPEQVAIRFRSWLRGE